MIGIMTTLAWEELVSFLQQATIRRLLRQGVWGWEQGQRHFHPMTSPLYLDTDVGMLEISTIINDSYLSFAVVATPTWDAFDEAGELDNAGLIDLSYEYFGDRNTVQCQELRCAYIAETDVESGHMAMMSITVDGGERVTLDPWNFSGLRVRGGVDLESVLAKNDFLASRTTIRTWTR